MSSSTNKRKTAKVIWQTQITGLDIILSQRGKDSFDLQYGKQFAQDRPYQETALDLGCCIMHALALDGKLNNG